MSPYAKNAAKHCIDGYYLPTRNEPLREAFLRAKEEALTHMRKAVADIEAIDEEMFFTKNKPV